MQEEIYLLLYQPEIKIEAGQTLNINDNGIGHCCRGKAKSAGGYIWKYYKQEKIEIMNNVKLKIKKIC